MTTVRPAILPAMREQVPAMPDETPVLNTLADMTAVSVAHGTLSAREHMLARLAALVAVDAPVASYVMNFEPSVELGLTLEDAQGLLVAVAPVVGTGAGRLSSGQSHRCSGIRDRRRHRRSRS